MAQPPDPLQPDETVLLEARRHPLSVLDGLLGWGALWLVLVGGTAYVLGVFYPAGWLPIGVPVLLVATTAFVAAATSLAWRVRTSRYILTPERVYKSHGRLRYHLDITTFDKVTDLHVRQSLFGRLRGFGTVRLETAGAGLALEGLVDPFGAKRTIERARSAFVARLVQEQQTRAVRAARTRAGPAGAAAVRQVGGAEATPALRTGTAAEEAEDAVPIWTGRPALPYFLGHIVAAGFFGLVGLAMLVGALFARPLVFAGATLLLVAAGNGLSAWAQYRYTRYEVLPEGVVVTSGWLTRRRVETTFDKVTDVATYQGVVGRLLDYGQITVNTAGGTVAPVVFRGLADPDAVKGVVDEARRAWRRRRA